MNEEMHEGARASTLDLPRAELEELAQVFCRMAVEHFAAAEALPVFPDTSAEQVAELFRTTLPEEGVGLESLARACAEVVRHSRQNGHPRMFGYVASPATPVGAFFELTKEAGR